MNTTGTQDAFPAITFYDERPIGCSDGLTKREFFAALAMQGLFAASRENYPSKGDVHAAVRAADWLIEALNETPENSAAQ